MAETKTIEPVSIRDTIKQNNANITKFSYPEDLGIASDMQHMVVFYINVRENSKRPGVSDALQTTDMPPVNMTGLAGAAVATGGALALSSLSISGATKRVVQGTAKNYMKSMLTNKAMLAGTATIAAGAAYLGGVNTTKLLKSAIALGIQAPPKASYRVNYDKHDLGSLIGGMSSSASNIGTSVLAAALKGAQVPASFGAPDFSNALQKMTGTGINPFRTVLFKDVDLRTFKYEYKFMPKSKKEAETVLQIIKTFKSHMHPEFADSNVFLIHPSEFSIVYYYGNKENENFNKISTCVLTELDHDYGSEKMASFDDGMAVEINLSLTFVETEMLTKEKIEDGY